MQSNEQANFGYTEFFTIRNLINIMVEKRSLYQTNKPSLRDISFPKIPVNPASITAICNNKYDFFIENDLSVEQDFKLIFS